MTLDEAKKLKHGDRVLVEMEVMRDSFFGETCSAGAVYIRAIGMEDVAAAVKPEFIREKVAPPRRRFKAGDVVYSFGKYWGLSHDEDNLGMVLMGCGSTQRHTHYSYVELICAAENREDRKEDA